MSFSAAGAAVGGIAGAGAWLVVGRAPRRRLRLHDRLAPYLRDAPRVSVLLAAHPTRALHPAVERLIGSLLRDAAGRLDSLLGGSGSVRRRLEFAGLDTTLDQFRVEQVTWAGAGLLSGLTLTLAAAAHGSSTTPLAALVVTAVLTIGGALARDRWLSMQVTRRNRRMLAELPVVAEMLALSVGAGEGVVGAVQRVSRLVNGELSRELRRALAETGAGAPLVDALDGVGRRTSLPAVTRFVNGLSVAVERGTPLADVLRAQAADARDEARRSLLEAGGRKEIAMLFPVVFLVLPVTVVFALFPGFANLSLAVP